MNIKKALCLLFAVAIFIISFASCAKPPKTEATTGTAVYKIGTTVLNTKTEENASVSEYITQEKDVKFIVSDYYEYKGNYGKMKNIKIDTSLNSAPTFLFDMEMIYIGNDSDKMLVSYICYDKDGNVLKDNGYIKIKLDGYKSNDTISGKRFQIPYDTAVVEFKNFTAE